MPVSVKHILRYLNEVAPFDQAESWDNNGLLVGSGSAEVSSILISLDPSLGVLEEAVALKCDTIISHHPIIFKPLPTIDTDTPTGKFIAKLLANGMNAIACHTNLDSAADSVSDILARKIGLTDLEPLLPKAVPDTGLGCVGRLKDAMSGREFVRIVMDTLDLDSVRIGGFIPEHVTTVGLCGGSGSEFAYRAKEMGVDVYITAEVKHSTARWAEDTRFCIIDATHYSTEKFAVNLLHSVLKKGAETNGWKINVYKSKTEKHPFAAIDKESLA